MALTVLIVDDEPLAREGLRMLLAEDRAFDRILEAKNGNEAHAAIASYKPDLVFLDVQMPEMDGLTLARALPLSTMPAVVFVTAFDQYAIDAFELNAVDYLLKPVTTNRFKHALQRVKERLSQETPGAMQQRLMTALEALSQPKQELKRLAVRSGGKTILVNVSEIEWVEAAENYVQLHTTAGNHLLHVPMATLEKSLPSEHFLRIHRSVIVNVNCVKELQPALHGEYVITLSSGKRLQSGRMYSARLKELSSNPF